MYNYPLTYVSTQLITNVVFIGPQRRMDTTIGWLDEISVQASRIYKYYACTNMVHPVILSSNLLNV